MKCENTVSLFLNSIILTVYNENGSTILIKLANLLSGPFGYPILDSSAFRYSLSLVFYQIDSLIHFLSSLEWHLWSFSRIIIYLDSGWIYSLQGVYINGNTF